MKDENVTYATEETLEESGATETKEGRSPMTQRKKMVLTIVVLGILIASCAFGYNAFLFESTDDAQVDGHVMPLSARINGHLEKVNVIEGQLVHAGDVLVTIDPTDYQVAVDQARANLADAEANAVSSRTNVPITSATAFSGLDSAASGVTNAEAGIDAAKHNLEAAKATLVQAEANAVKTDADLTRYAQLVAKEDISKQQYDQAVAAAKANRAAVVSASAAVQSSEQALRQAESRLLQAKANHRSASTAPEQVTVARAKADCADALVEKRKAELKQAELNLSYTVIRTPVDAIVGKKTAEIGQNVNAGQELVTVVPLDDVWVTANFKETQLEHMRPGQPVVIKLDAYGQRWKGHVTNLGGGTGSVFSLLPAENATGNYVKVVQRVPVRIDFDRDNAKNFNADGRLKPGMSVEPEVKVR